MDHFQGSWMPGRLILVRGVMISRRSVTEFIETDRSLVLSGIYGTRTCASWAGTKGSQLRSDNFADMSDFPRGESSQVAFGNQKHWTSRLPRTPAIISGLHACQPEHEIRMRGLIRYVRPASSQAGSARHTQYQPIIRSSWLRDPG